MRQVISFNDGWEFYKPGEAGVQVNLPHTWNGEDGQRGGEYLRAACIYEKKVSLEEIVRKAFSYSPRADHRDPLSSYEMNLYSSDNSDRRCSNETNPSFSDAAETENTAVLSNPDFFRDHQIWISFDGVNASAEVSVNGEVVCRHDGGYSRFRANITEALHTEDFSYINVIRIKVDNTVNRRVYPQKADFTFYGGIYRDVHLIIVPSRHIALGDYGSDGVWVKSRILKYFPDGCADVDLEVHVKIEHDKKFEDEKEEEKEGARNGKDFSVTSLPIPSVKILNFEDEKKAAIKRPYFPKDQPQCQKVKKQAEPQKSQDESFAGCVGNLVRDHSSDDEFVFQAHLDHARLWNGRKDPYLYKAVVTLGEDEVEIPFGIREVKMTKDGFFLNRRKYPLHGVSRHQDRPGIGNAITREMHEGDFRLILDMGANAIRLAHYQHAQEFYNLCDRYGIVVWAEIPYISEDMGNAEADKNTRSQMRELILQNWNHPSIAMWGISNEITISTKDKKSMLANHRYLNELVHKLDPSRPTVLACYAMCGFFNPVAHLTDAVGWNLYLGWYVPGKWLNDLWVTFFHLFCPNRPLCFSEYGAEGMPGLHSTHPHRGDQSEEYQASYHAWMLRFFERHPWMWGSFAWTMYDFASSIRNEGGDPGKNHKGLVTFDRRTKKDAFYVYKAYWSQDPFVHIASKRFVYRTEKKTTVRVYSNLPEVTLYLNGEKWSTQRNQGNTHEFVFRHVPIARMASEPTIHESRPSSGESGSNSRKNKSALRGSNFAGWNKNTGRLLKVKVVGGKEKGGIVTDEAVFLYSKHPDPSYRLKKGKSSNWV